jgi:predicted nucleotidyltransferase component of viral defense system
MMSILTPQLSTLPDPQLKLWDELSHTPSNFILYGGTAIALRMGHRKSIDFDFFSPAPFDPELLYRDIAYLKDARVVQQSKNTLTCSIDRGGEVLVSFFGGLNIGQVETPSLVKSNNIKVASLKDLAGTKAAVIQKRVEPKDYLDIEALLTDGNLTLEMILACGKIVYDKAFNPYITLKALCYFDEIELESLSSDTKKKLIKVVNEVNLDNLPELSRTVLGTIT